MKKPNKSLFSFKVIKELDKCNSLDDLMKADVPDEIKEFFHNRFMNCSDDTDKD